MRILTWNVWWKFGPWMERQPAIEAELRRADADIVTLQEVWADDTGDQAASVAEKLGYHVIRSRRTDGSPQRFGNAILSRRPLTFLEQVPLPDLDGQPTKRTALIAADDSGPQPRLIVTTHLTWQYYASATRQVQLEAIVGAVDRHRQRDGRSAAVIITGDLNGTPESQEVRRLTGLEPGYHPELIFIDSWAAVGEGVGHTWTRDNPHAAQATWPRRRLDYVLVSWPREKPFCSPLSAELAGTESVSIDGAPAIVASDHYAVVAELDDRTEETAAS